MVAGEPPVTKQYDNVEVVGSRYSLTDPVLKSIETNIARFGIPPNIAQMIQGKAKLKDALSMETMINESRCFEAQAVTFRYNPFVYIEGGFRQVSLSCECMFSFVRI